MPSQKYLFIKACLTRASNVEFLNRKLMVLAQMYVDIDKGFRFSYISDENGEIEFLNTLRGHYHKDFTYFDVGAHFGTYTDMITAKFSSYHGHLFEPTRTTYQTCMTRHGTDQKLRINNAALSDEAGEVEYRIYPDDPTRNGIAGVRSEAHFESELESVPCWTGDSYSKEQGIEHIHLLKIDAEGYDLHVIKGFEHMLDQGQIDIIQFEYNVKHSETHCMLGDFHAFLKDKNYIIGPLRPEGVDFKDFDFFQNDFKTGPNYIACRPEFRDLLSRFV